MNRWDNMLLDYLVENYEQGEPIFCADIKISEMSEVNLRQQLKKLVDDGKLNRFEQGVYYIPRKNRLKGGIGLSSETVAQCKYVVRKGKRIGYYTGHTLANHLGISTQVPYKEEIVSNNMSAVVREVIVGTKTYLVRKPVVVINEDNYRILQLLDLLKDVEKYSDVEPELIKNRLCSYIRKNQITRNEVDLYIGMFPLKVYKNIFEMRLDYVFA